MWQITTMKNVLLKIISSELLTTVLAVELLTAVLAVDLVYPITVMGRLLDFHALCAPKPVYKANKSLTFEIEINHAGAGGLWAELVNNRVAHNFRVCLKLRKEKRARDMEVRPLVQEDDGKVLFE
ncbi:hypothetical protein Tco_1176209 [Tanacetum coccineum]